MEIATFTAATGWAGRHIHYDDGVFSLEGHGPISATDVLAYDRRGQIEWAYAGLREWVEQVASLGVPKPAAKRMPAWKVVLIVAAAVLAMGVCAAVAIPMFVNQNEKAKEASVKEGIQAIQIAVHEHAVANGDVFPAPETVTAAGLGRYIDAWPENPYSDEPMAQGLGPGEFTYTVSPDRMPYTLVGHGRDGRDVITVGY